METQIDREELRSVARRVLDDNLDRRNAYEIAPKSNDALRNTMVELGWFLLNTPEELDGLGQSFSALSVIYQELGKSVAQVACIGSFVAVDVLVPFANSAGVAELLANIGCGEATVATYLICSDALKIEQDNSTARISANLVSVMDGGDASHLLLIPSDSTSKPVVLVDLRADGVNITLADFWDRSRNLADIQLDKVACQLLVSGGEALNVAAVAQAHFDLAIACDSVGGADQSLQEAIGYMANREQFNRPIGSFQALKHRTADLKVELEIARAVVNRASELYSERVDGWQTSAAQAKLLATEAYFAIAEEAVQFHGGVGYTWEYDCHLFLKRACLNRMLAGTAEQVKDRIAPDIFQRLIGLSLAG